MYVFIYFWLCWVFIAVLRLPLVVVRRGYSSWWSSGFSCCSTRAQQLWGTSFIAPQHVESSQTRD